jgi:hypothetical protein
MPDGRLELKIQLACTPAKLSAPQARPRDTRNYIQFTVCFAHVGVRSTTISLAYSRYSLRLTV